MTLSGRDSRCHHWASILARGDGKRLLPLTRPIAGDDRPKQFCAVLGDQTLLQETQRRVSQLVQSWRTLLVLTSTHEAFYADEVAGIPSSRLLIQPSNQGTAPAILYSLMRLREMDPKGVVGFFPSDHHFSNDQAFLGHIDSAYAAAASRSEVIILLGIPPDAPEAEYGWIEPVVPLGTPAPDWQLSAKRQRGNWMRRLPTGGDTRVTPDQLLLWQFGATQQIRRIESGVFSRMWRGCLSSQLKS